MRQKLLALSTLALCLSVSGCGGSKLDSRQLDWNNGLAYKHGSSTPYSGLVEWTTEIPNVLSNYWGYLFGTNLSYCETHFVEGVMDGAATCGASNGKTVLEVVFSHEQFNGTATFHNPGNGALVRELHLSNGKLDGVAKNFSADGNQLLQQVTWKNGVQDGPTKTWDAGGRLLTDTVWKDGHIFSGHYSGAEGVLEYKDGQLDGPQLFLNAAGSGVKSKGEFSQGNRVGAWQDDKFALSEILIVPRFQQFESIKSWIESAISNKVDHATSNWKGGALDGDLVAVDKDGNTVIKAHFDNGAINGPFEFLDTQDNTMRQVVFKNGAIVKGDHVLSTQISDTTIVGGASAPE